MAKVKITQVRSSIDRSQKQKRTLEALGLRKINSSVEHDLNDTIRGMINRVSHLVEVEEFDQAQDSSPVANPAASVTRQSVLQEEE